MAQLKDNLNVPVQRVGSLIIRSEPGEDPRRESGKLWRSIKHKLEARAETAEDLVIYTNDPKARWLNDGTENMEPRPFWDRAGRLFAREIPRRFKREVAERLRR